MSDIRPCISVLIFSAAIVGSVAATGQVSDALLEKYKDEQAVISSMKRQLVIRNEHGKLVAQSYFSTEKVLIGSLSPGLFNKEYIFHSYFNQLEDHEAVALVPGKKGYERRKPSNTETTRYEESNILYDDTQQTEISFSGLSPRSVLQNSYTLTHTDLRLIPSYYVQENMPVAQSLFEVTAPKYVHMKFVIKGAMAGIISESIEESKNTITYHFAASAVPALKNLDFVPSDDWYALHIVPYIESYQLPGEDETHYLGDTDHLYQYLYEFIRNVNTKQDDSLAKITEAITRGDKTPWQKAAHIYQWVQTNIHYIAFEDSLEGFIPRQAAAICRRKFGDCKDMASILVALCRNAGLQAYFTWIGTSSKPYTYQETPLPKVANHMICTIRLGDQWIFMDGTHPLIPFGEAPSVLQHKEALIGIDEKQYKIVTVPESDETHSRVYDTTLIELKDNQLSGKVMMQLEGYPSWKLQTELAYEKNEARDKFLRAVLSRGSNKYQQGACTFVASDTGFKSCHLSADFTLDNYMQKVGKEYYLNMNLRTYFDDNHIDTAERKVPEYFAYREVGTEVVVLTVPKGYHVSYIPPAANGSVDDVWDFHLSYHQEGAKLILVKEIRFHTMTMPVSSFSKHNKMVEELRKQYKETVVLTAD